MTRFEIMLTFDIFDFYDEELVSFDNDLRKKLYKCNEEEYSKFCETMEDKGYCSVRIYPFCVNADDCEELRKALTWISDNSELIKSIGKDWGTKIQLVIKFLVKRDFLESLGFFSDYPAELVFSPNDLALLKDHDIDLNITAEYSDGIGDEDDQNDEVDEE